MESELGDINDGGTLGLILGVLLLGGFRKKTPQLIDVDGGSILSVEVSSEDTDTLLTKVSRVVLEDVGSLMGQTTGLASTGGMLAVLSDSTVTVGHVASQLSALSFASGLITPTPTILDEISLYNSFNAA